MIDQATYHEKRNSSPRRKEDQDRIFLLKIMKTCLRMNSLDVIKDTLTHTVDFVENGERQIREEIGGIK